MAGCFGVTDDGIRVVRRPSRSGSDAEFDAVEVLRAADCRAGGLAIRIEQGLQYIECRDLVRSMAVNRESMTWHGAYYSSLGAINPAVWQLGEVAGVFGELQSGDQY